MKPSANCLALIKASEGLRLAPYRCPAGVPTIGYGNTRYADGRAVKLSDPPITQAQADALLMATLQPYADAVNRLVKVQINQNQFDALVDFAFNVGTDEDEDTIAEGLGDSKLLKLLNAGNYSGAAAQFDVWVMAGGRRLPGLVKRRALEKQLFLKSV